MTREFLIGNGYVFEENDVLSTIKALNPEYKTLIVEKIAESLMQTVREAKDNPSEDTTEDTTEEMLEALDALKEISRISSLTYSHAKS